MGLQEEIDRLKKDNQAIHQEFTHSPATQDKIQKQLTDLVPDAIGNINHLINHAESESVRLNASKYVIDIARSASSTDDAISKLIGELKGTPIDTP
jgi:hypothetical protein